MLVPSKRPLLDGPKLWCVEEEGWEESLSECWLLRLAQEKRFSFFHFVFCFFFGYSFSLFLPRLPQIIPADPALPTSRQEVRQQPGQVWCPNTAFKTAQAIQDFNRGEELPLLILANWRGFSGGMRDMFNEILKYGAYIVDALKEYKQVFLFLSKPFFPPFLSLSFKSNYFPPFSLSSSTCLPMPNSVVVPGLSWTPPSTKR